MNRRCHYCNNLLVPKFTIVCGEHCKSVIYCSTKCANDDWNLEHGIWCARIAEIVQTFEVSQCQHTELAQNDFEALLLPHFLASRGLHGKGLWSLFVQPPTDATKSLELFASGEWASALNLSAEAAILSLHHRAPSTPLLSWAEYLTWRALPLDSIVPLILHWPLTLYYISSVLWPASSSPCSTASSLHVHIIGAEQEVHWLPAFSELNSLLSEQDVHLHFIGPRVPKSVHGRQVCHGRVTACFHRGLYHTYTPADKPHLIIGFNAGLCAYASWKDTIQWLEILSVPAFFTDYNQFVCDYTTHQLTSQHLATSTLAVVNPFRSIMRKSCDSHDIPSYSNCAIYQLTFE